MEYYVLIIDECNELARTIKLKLEETNYIVSIESNGILALKKIDNNRYNLIIISCESFNIDTYEILKKIREKYNLPIILLSIASIEEEKHRGIELGADAYFIRPVNITDLALSVKALIRRTYEYEVKENEIIDRKDIVINTSSRKVYVKGKNVELTSKEYDILYLLITNPGKIFNREMLIEILWGFDYFGYPRTVDVHIRRLREKIEKNPDSPTYIMTKWGYGYFYKE